MAQSPVDQLSTRLTLCARFIAGRLAHVMSAIAARYALLLQQADDESPSFR
jgi:hypothetical protein